MSKAFPLKIIDGREHAIALTVSPAPVHITAADIGHLFADANGDDQAELLFQIAEAVDQWGDYSSGRWAFQCRTIAESMPDELCRRICRLLEPLVEHLECVPVERAAAKTTDTVCDTVKELLS